ncbi:hypothetical protein AOA62_04595 [Pseudomonas sp. 2995-3]|nr:hypothetical protein AOA62_04595 [Pseudomonas sp. 2995-3]
MRVLGDTKGAWADSRMRGVRVGAVLEVHRVAATFEFEIVIAALQAQDGNRASQCCGEHHSRRGDQRQQ